MKTEAVTTAGNCPVDGTVRPVAWVVEFLGDEKELYFERKPYGVRQLPLYDQAALDAAVAAERAKWKLLTDDSKHIFNGGCPERGNWNGRDPECPACVALGEWQA